MAASEAWSLNSISREPTDLDVSLSGFADLGMAPGRFILAAGHRHEVARALEITQLDQVAVRLELDTGRTRIRPASGPDLPRRVVQVRPRLHFDAADITRVKREISRQNPDVVVVEGAAGTRFDDLHWAAVIADQLDTPTFITFATDVAATGQQPGPEASAEPISAASLPDLFAVGPNRSYLNAVLNLRGHALSRFDVSGLDIPGLDIPGASGAETDAPSAAESEASPPRYVNSVIRRSADHAAVGAGEVLALDTAYRLGIGIGRPRADSLLAGTAPWPDDVLARVVPRRARRLDILVIRKGSYRTKPKAGCLYLPEDGPAFTCPRCDQMPPDTDWHGVDHAECSDQHDELAEFTIPKRSSPGVLELEVLLYLGAALVHKHRVQLSVQEGPGASAKVTFSLVHVFARLPVLIDRVASIDVGPDHLTVNAIGSAGTFTFRFSDTNWNPSAVAVRKALTTLHFRKVTNGYEPCYPDVAVPPAKYRDMLLRMATVGRQLYNQIFNTSASAGLAPLLRHEAEARDQAPVVQIARTAQRPFAVPWQVLYDLPMEHPDESLLRCPSVDDYGPGGAGTWPPPAVCPNRKDHERAESAVLCPWGFWGLAHVLEVPEPPPGERSLDQVISDGDTLPTVLVGTGSGLQKKALDKHLAKLGRQVAGFPAAPDDLVTAARQLRSALEPAAMDVVYLLSHAQQSGESGLSSALVFPDRQLDSDEIAVWTRDDWPADHWDGRRPLVVLNACHTAEIVQSTLGGFVSNFVASGASGVIGTETLIDQMTASEAMEHFLTAFSAGATAGEAIRLMRWRLLGSGSMLGFSYTPYCAASLRLRPLVESR